MVGRRLGRLGAVIRICVEGWEGRGIACLPGTGLKLVRMGRDQVIV